MRHLKALSLAQYTHPLLPLTVAYLFSIVPLAFLLITSSAQAAPATVTRVNALATQQIASGTGGLFGVTPVNAGGNFAVQCFNGDCPQNPPCPTTTGATPFNLLYAGTSGNGLVQVPAAGARFTNGLCCCSNSAVLVYWSN